MSLGIWTIYNKYDCLVFIIPRYQKMGFAEILWDRGNHLKCKKQMEAWSLTVSRDEAFCLDFHWYSNKPKKSRGEGLGAYGRVKKVCPNIS